ncbi:RICIN domain-containing protein [Streptomyces sp. NBC_01538]|uniref:RICIN domain-containing protein n=1 Tax=Streptomyces sp. NBC_01538 TaxID=2903897 RepID=UPI0038661ECA
MPASSFLACSGDRQPAAFRDQDEKGRNPPHLLARDAYDKVTALPLLCTGEYPTTDEPRLVVFALDRFLGFELVDVANQQFQLRAVTVLGNSDDDLLVAVRRRKCVDVRTISTSLRERIYEWTCGAASGLTSKKDQVWRLLGKDCSGADLAVSPGRRGDGRPRWCGTREGRDFRSWPSRPGRCLAGEGGRCQLPGSRARRARQALRGSTCAPARPPPSTSAGIGGLLRGMHS